MFGGGPGFPQEKGQFRDVTSTPLILSVDDLVDWAETSMPTSTGNSTSGTQHKKVAVLSRPPRIESNQI